MSFHLVPEKSFYGLLVNFLSLLVVRSNFTCLQKFHLIFFRIVLADLKENRSNFGRTPFYHIFSLPIHLLPPMLQTYLHFHSSIPPCSSFCPSLRSRPMLISCILRDPTPISYHFSSGYSTFPSFSVTLPWLQNCGQLSCVSKNSQPHVFCYFLPFCLHPISLKE